MSAWFVYMVRCSDDTLYTGISTDVARRVREHNGIRKGARYTRTRQPVELVYCNGPLPGQSEALREERRMKNLSRRAKLALAHAWRHTKR